MARLRAVVVIQPPSARSMSPRTRIKVAVQRPASRRKTSSRPSVTLVRAGPQPVPRRPRMPSRPIRAHHQDRWLR